jgi:hypothetical protein
MGTYFLKGEGGIMVLMLCTKKTAAQGDGFWQV